MSELCLLNSQDEDWHRWDIVITDNSITTYINTVPQIASGQSLRQ